MRLMSVWTVLIFVASGCASAPLAGIPDDPARTLFWIDTDIGLAPDDFMALIVASQVLGERLIGVSTSLYDPQGKARTARVILDELGRPDVPVYTGLGLAAGSLSDFRKHYPAWPPAWGELYRSQGQGVKGVFDREWRVARSESTDAVDALLAAIHAHPHRLVVVALGPLTNIARALQVDPQAATLMARLVVMGGWYLNPDGSVKRPSFNTAMDLPAARTVFDRMDLDVLLVNSQALSQAALQVPQLRFRRLREPGSRCRLNQALSKDVDDWTRAMGNGAAPLALADPVTVLVAAEPAWAIADRAARISLSQLPDVHLAHPDAGRLIAFALADPGNARLRIVERFVNITEVKEKVLNALRQGLDCSRKR